MNNELVPADNTPAALIRHALDQRVDVEKLGALFEMQRRWEADQAAKKYAEAISGFQADCPPIVKTRAVMNKGGTSIRYKFAAWEDIAPIVNPILAKYAIGVHFMTPEPAPGRFYMVLRVRVGAHVEEFPFNVPMPDVKAIAEAAWCNETQAIGIIESYFKRYHFTNTFNITIVGEDNDAADLMNSCEPITAEQVGFIRQLLAEREKDEHKFLAWVRSFQKDADGIEQIASANYDKAVDAIRKSQSKGGSPR